MRPQLVPERAIEALQIKNRLDEVYRSVYAQREPIRSLEFVVTGEGKGPEAPPTKGWKPFEMYQRWGGFDQTTWFRMGVTIPKSMAGKRVVALIRAAEWSMIPGATGLTEGGESLAYVNGAPFQGLDRNRDELLLTKKARTNQEFEIVLEACPSTRFDLHHIFSYADIAVFEQAPWDFYWDARVVMDTCDVLPENTAPRRRMMELLNDCVKMVDLGHVGEPAYFDSLKKAQRKLRAGLKEFPGSSGMGKLILAGHSHIDTAWLWPTRETRRKCSRTFSTILELMDRYPEFHFSCSQPIQYVWIKEHYPEIFARIKKRVAEGRWELCGAPWVEPDHNIPSGESLIRQYLYGNRWFDREFGKRSHIAWVPDSFGYNWQLPQIMRTCQLSAFVTTKIDWSQISEFPYSMFLWEGADGTRIPAVMPPLNYNGNITPKDCIDQWTLFKQKERVEELVFPFGFGDGGGGPTMAMIETGKRLGDFMGVPKCEFGRIEDCVDRMVEQADPERLPVFSDELYLELHRACQTTQARTKRNNRKCEVLLRNAEFFSSLALLAGGAYPEEELHEAWHLVLLNQFHDILPGSSLQEVYDQCDIDYARALELISAANTRALETLVGAIDTRGEGEALIVWNTLPWLRDGLVEVEAPLPTGPFSVLDAQGEPVPYQKAGKNRVLVPVTGIPPMGYAIYRIVSGRRKTPETAMISVSINALENEILKVKFDKKGRITSVFDKESEREVLAPGGKGNVLQFFEDRPYLHDAWDTDFNYEENQWELSKPAKVQIIETGPLRGVLRFTWKTEKSTIEQDVVLATGSPRLEFHTRVDWWEKRTLLKVAFPVDVRSSSATYEIQYGAIERPTHWNRPHDRARFEVTGLKWADLSEGDYGVSLLNDCKYSYDVHDNVMRLSLLRSSIDPDPHADEGQHEFTYALYPHGGDWRYGAVQEGYELNVPLAGTVVAASVGDAPSAQSFAFADVDNVIVDTVKRHEDSNAIIVRVYEAYGQRGDVNLTFGPTPIEAWECDGMEENDKPVSLKGNVLSFRVTPYQIRTFKIRFIK